MRLPFFYGWIIVAVTFVTMAIGVNARTARATVRSAAAAAESADQSKDPDSSRTIVDVPRPSHRVF